MTSPPHRPTAGRRQERAEGPGRGAAGADEEAAIERARRGDRRAYEALVRAHYARVYATAFHLLGNHEDAEDLAQEAFVRAHRGLDHYRGGDGGAAAGSFRAWLHRIVVHLAHDRFRRTARRPLRASLEEARALVAGHGPVQELSGRELGRRVADAIANLPDDLRIALSLRVRDGWSYDELAAATGVSPKTARNRVMKARRALRRWLTPLLDEEESP